MAGLRDGDPGLHLGQAVADLLDRGRERGVEHHRLGVGVVEQVEQFVGDIAVVGVHRRQAGLEGGEVGLEVFGAVVEVGGDLGLMRQAGVQQMPGHTVGAAVEILPADDRLSPDLSGTLRDGGGYGFPEVGIGPDGHGGLAPDCVLWRRMAGCSQGSQTGPGGLSLAATLPP